MAKKVLAFISKGPKSKSDDGVVIDHGEIDKLKYEVYKRGAEKGSPILVLHIFNDKAKELRFKKDAALFETELDKIDFSAMSEGHEKTIKGSGDNADLVMKMKNGDIVLSLNAKGLTMINKLKDILHKNQ